MISQVDLSEGLSALIATARARIANKAVEDLLQSANVLADYQLQTTDYDPRVDKLLRTNDILKLLSVSRSTFDRWVKKKYFCQHNLKIGRSKMWTERRVTAWINQQRSTEVEP